MGVYARPDSPMWWMLLESRGTRASTGIPRDGGSPAQNKELRRQAQEVYVLAQAAAAHATAAGVHVLPVISWTKWAAWYETHDVVHHRGATKERSILRQLHAWFSRFDSIALVDEPAVKEWMTARSKQVKRATVNRELDVLKQILRAAVPTYLHRYPLGDVRRMRVEESEPRVLTTDEEARLLAICGPEDKAFLILALDTLLRLSSVVHLKWAQVKFSQRSILPLNAKVSTGAKPMSSRLETALKALGQTSAYVFGSFHAKGTGTTAPKNRAIRRFTLLCQRARVPYGRAADGVTFHCLRHTGATRALQAGYSVRTVMNLGGWTNEHTVMRYVHTTDSDVFAAAESIGNHAALTRLKTG